MKLCCPMGRSADVGKLTLRLTVGILMLFHGVAKITGGVDWIMPMLAGIGLPGIIAYGVYAGEVLAPLMVIAGWRARLGAVLMAGTMVFAVVLAHMKDLFALDGYGGYALEPQVFFLMGSVAIFFFGAGRFAVSQNNSWD